MSLKALFADRWKRLFLHDMWNIAIVDQPIEAFLESDFKPETNWIRPLKGERFLADPFGIKVGDVTHVLCEEFDYAKFKGRIVSIEVGGDLFSDPKVVMEFPFHVSYPFLLSKGGSIYCVPESSKAREIAMYRATNFPSAWEKINILVNDFAGLDNTLFQHEGRWWIASTSNDTGSLETLYLWYADDLLGSWRPHVRNPVKVDIRSARPGGTPFTRRGRLYRPAQDSSMTYGGRVVINRVNKLTPSEFEEEEVAAVGPLKPGPYPEGVHTLSSVDDSTLIDAKRIGFVRNGARHALQRRITHYTAYMRQAG